MKDALRTAYRYWTLILLLAVVAQVAGAAYGAFYTASKLNAQHGEDESKIINEKLFDHGFGFHVAFGYFIFLGAVILLLLALGARLGRPRIWSDVALPILVAIQIAIFAWGGEDHPVLGLFHGINALVIFGLTGSLAMREWRPRMRKDEAVVSEVATAPR